MKLIEAIQQRNTYEAKRLLNLKPSERDFGINDVDSKTGATALEWAARLGYDDLIPLLVKEGADVNKTDKDGKTLVFLAAECGNAKFITALHAAGADMNKSQKNGETPIYIAALRNHADCITALYNVGVSVNTSYKNGFTLVHEAVSSNSKCADTIAALRAAGANMNTPENKDGRTPIYIAAQLGFIGAVTALLAAGADPNIPNKYNETLACSAASQGLAAVIRALQTSKADMNTPDRYGITPVFAAIAYCCGAEIHEVMVALYAAGADMNKPNKDGITPIFAAVQNRKVDLVRCLLFKCNADRNVRVNGKTPLELAKNMGRMEMIVSLLESSVPGHSAASAGSHSKKAIEPFTPAANQEGGSMKQSPLTMPPQPNRLVAPQVSPVTHNRGAQALPFPTNALPALTQLQEVVANQIQPLLSKAVQEVQEAHEKTKLEVQLLQKKLQEKNELAASVSIALENERAHTKALQVALHKLELELKSVKLELEARCEKEHNEKNELKCSEIPTALIFTENYGVVKDNPPEHQLSSTKDKQEPG